MTKVYILWQVGDGNCSLMGVYATSDAAAKARRKAVDPLLDPDEQEESFEDDFMVSCEIVEG